MLANELIDRLERLGLLDQEIIEALREQLAQGGTRVTPEAVAKLLVDNGQLTHFQATKLIGELRSGQYDEDDAEEADLTAGVEELDIVPEDADDVVEAVVEAEPMDAAVEAMPVEAMPVAAVPVAAEPMSVGDAMVAEANGNGDAPAARPESRVKKADPEKSVWDSFKIYGYAGIIILLILIGSGIAFVLSREDADTVIGRAHKFYEQQNYSQAQGAYNQFLDSYGQNHQYSSISRTRIAMTNLYRAAEFRNDPGRALEIEAEQLPLIEKENEDGLNQERANLAQLLVSVAKNIAENAVDEPDTEKKRDLLEKLDQQIEYTNDSNYITATVRASLAAQIDSVMEDRKRVERDINRNVSLDESEASMKESLAETNTKRAYDIRKRLLRDYPELFDNERLISLIREASGIQQKLVEPSANLPKLVADVQNGADARAIVLTTPSGDRSGDLVGETLYLRAGGSVLAFDGEYGKLKWRRFVGYAKDLPPVRISKGRAVILSDSSTRDVMRCEAEDGEVRWRTKIDESFSEPVVRRDDIYVSAHSGRLVKLDADSGEANWVTQIPQPIEVGPGIGSYSKAYLPGNHSNLYVINSDDGSCVESFYVGHAEGTIAVSPVALLGHLFVIENAGTDFCNIHVLKFDGEGASLERAQQPFRLNGNVTVSPIIQGRRLIVLTDHGEVAVYDIEPTAEDSEKVTLAASSAPFMNKPTRTQMAVEGSQMWITGASVGRFELQINTGSVVRGWDHHAHDTFIGRPFAVDGALVYSRMLRGTKTIRVTCVDPKSGDEIWRTDVGVPVSMITQAPGSGVHVVTSQAALFSLGRDELANGSTAGPIENPGSKQITSLYTDPMDAGPNKSVMINQTTKSHVLVYAPERQSEWLRAVKLGIHDADLSGGAAIVGGGLLLPLSNGRVVMVDYRTGVENAAPFQPASDPASEVSWSTAVMLPSDPEQVVIADSRKKIYRLRAKSKEQIRQLASKDLEFKFIGPAAGVGNTFFATFTGPSADYVVGHNLVSLDEKFRTLLNGRVVWGPIAANGTCLIQTDDQMLRAISEDGSQQFEVELPQGTPVGKPLLVGENIVVCGQSGWIVAIDKSSGQIVGESDLGEPISATPLIAGTSMLVPGAEGVVYIIKIPGA